MVKEISKNPTTLWKKEPITFSKFHTLSYGECLQLVLTIPEKFRTVSQFLEEENASKELVPKTTSARNVEESEMAQILYLKSGDNDKADLIYNEININQGRTIEFVSNHFLPPVYVVEVMFLSCLCVCLSVCVCVCLCVCVSVQVITFE